MTSKIGTSLKHIFTLISLLLFAFTISESEAFIRRPNVGLMKLCPPGGESFAAAWEITCGMKRKKRSLALAEEDLEGNLIQKRVNYGWNNIDKLSSAAELKRNSIETNRSTKLINGGKAKEQYRVPSMTEMMLFCCRFGCSLRDLMPYCDPFGGWDS